VAQPSSHCHACRKNVVGNPKVCPFCAAPNPTLSYERTIRVIATFVVLIIVASSVSILFRDKSATRPYKIGLAYPVAKAGPICRTTKVLDTARQNRIATVDQAEALGCLMLDPAIIAKVVLIDKDPDVLKVRVLAPHQRADAFEGWTDIETLGSYPVRAN
jgi:hypothetical protein